MLATAACTAQCGASTCVFRSRHTYAAMVMRRAVRGTRLRAMDSAVELAAELSSPAAVRKALLARGWDLAWIDGVTGEMIKRKLSVSVSHIEAVIGYLEGLGIPTKSVENMASINKQILAQPLQSLQAVIDYAQRQGATGASLVSLLEMHPNLLTYVVSADGRQLEKGAARASVDVLERGGKRLAGVSFWREGATFESAPVAPYKPQAVAH